MQRKLEPLRGWKDSKMPYKAATAKRLLLALYREFIATLSIAI